MGIGLFAEISELIFHSFLEFCYTIQIVESE